MYYSTLFNTFKQLLNDEHVGELASQIAEFEKWLSDDMNKLTLEEAEMRMYQNNDLTSGFEVSGNFITQFEINQKLEQIKQWLIRLHFMYGRELRFTQPIQI